MIKTREELEEEERRRLAPYGFVSGDTAGREYPELPPVNRTHFQRDWNRITHSEAFRKLPFKTQVFVFGEGLDITRNRLTHTLEVSQIAVTLARRLGLNEDLTQTISLAHDLGHPPFGHSGEERLASLANGFNHNEFGVKILREVELRFPDFPGLNLTIETLEGMEKHSTEYDRVENPQFLPGLSPTLEAQLVSTADMIAFRSHDLEDGLRTEIIREDDLDASGSELWQEVKERVKGLTGKVRRAQVARHLIDIVATDACFETDRRIKESGIRSVEDVRKSGRETVGLSRGMEVRVSKLGEFLMNGFYRHPRVVFGTSRGQEIIEKLFQKYIAEPMLLGRSVRERLDRCNEEGKRTLIAEYIAQMTDRYAMEEFEKIVH